MSIYDLPVNKNGRVYPPDVIRKMVADSQEKIKAGRMIGEVEPPGDGRSRMSHASHVVRGIRVESDGSIIGTIEFLDNPAGRIAEAMVKQRLPMSATMRGMGTVDENKVVIDATLNNLDITMFESETPPPSAVDQMGDLVREGDEDDA